MVRPLITVSVWVTTLIRNSAFLLGIINHQHSLTMVKRVAHRSTERPDAHLPRSLPINTLQTALFFLFSTQQVSIVTSLSLPHTLSDILTLPHSQTAQHSSHLPGTFLSFSVCASVRFPTHPCTSFLLYSHREQ